MCPPSWVASSIERTASAKGRTTFAPREARPIAPMTGPLPGDGGATLVDAQEQADRTSVVRVWLPP